MTEPKLTKQEAIETFLQVECSKKECDGGPWCTAQTKIREAFGYPANWKVVREIEQHHQMLKKLSSELEGLTKQELSLDNLRQIARVRNKVGSISSCLYDKHFKLPTVKLQRGEKDYEERLKEVIGSGRDYIIVSETGGLTVSGGSLGSEFDDYFYTSCDACYPETKIKVNISEDND